MKQTFDEIVFDPFSLVRHIYNKGYTKKQIRDLYKVIEWMMDLSEDLQQEFMEKLTKYEEEMHMPYVVSFEKRGIEKGIIIGMEKGIEKGIEKGMEKGKEQGLLLGAQKTVKRLLSRRFDKISPFLMEQIDTLDLNSLDKLSDSLLDFSSVADLQNWLKNKA